MAHTKVTKTHSQNTGAANTYSYSGSFDVFKATEVEVELDNVALTYTASTINESASPREYTVDVSAKTIHIGGADLSSGSIVIRPVTDMGAPTPRATYTPGASITSADLNNNQKQLMRKAMEYDEQKLSSTGGTMTGNLTIGEDNTIIFEGGTDDAYETTLTVTDPTADRTITLPNVTGTVVTTGDTATVTATMLAANSVDSSELVDGSIDTSHIANSQVTTDKIANGAINNAKLADAILSSTKYQDGSIETAKIADAQITTAKLADTAVTTAKITDGNVTTAKIAADAITAAKIADDVVNSEHYAAASIDTEHIADSQITTAKIAADAVTNAKIADDQIDSEHYVDGSIDTAHIGDNQVTTAKIADSNITTAKIATANVTHAKLANDAVDGDNIADDSVNSEHYVDASIDTAHLADGQVTAVKVASNAVTTAKITDANVTTDKIADDAITIGKIGCEQTTISDSDSHVPTSGAVVDYVAAQIAPIGGLEVIATDAAFPNTQPAAGVVISIADAGGLVVNGSGTSTTGRTVGSSTVTINNIASNFNSSTVDAGVAMMVSSTGSGQIYNYHKATLKEADLLSLSNDINDFAARYRVVAGEPGSNNDEGDLIYDTNADKMKVYDSAASAWKEVTSSGDFKFLVPVDAGTTTAATWDGSDTSFDLKETSTSGSAAAVTSIYQIMVSVNGVVQKPNTGTYSASEEGFYLTDSDTIRFCTAPPSNSTVFIIQFGSALTITTPGDGTVATAKIASGAVTTAKLADANVTTAKLASDAVTGAKIADDAIDSEHYVNGSIDAVHLADNACTEQKMANDAISTNKIVDDAVNSDKIANNAVGADQIADDAVGAEHIEQLDADLSFADSVEAKFGAGNDLKLWHNATDSYITNATGDLYIQGNGDDLHIRAADDINIYTQTSDKAIVCVGDGAVELYHDNSKKVETASDGVIVTGNVQIADNNYIKFGDTGTADFYIGHSPDNSCNLFRSHSSNIVTKFQAVTENMVVMTPNAAVELYYDGNKKLDTVSDGIDVTGRVTTDELTVKKASGNLGVMIEADDGLGTIELGGSAGAFIDLKSPITDDFDLRIDNGGTFTNVGSFTFTVNSNENGLRVLANGACELYHDNVKQLETFGTGIIVGGSDQEPGRGDTNVGSSLKTDGRIFVNSAGSYSSFGRNDTGVVVAFVRAGGDQGNISVDVGSTTFNSGSDYRKKENDVTIADGITKLKQLRPIRFNWKEDSSKTLIDGFFAHEVQNVIPSCVDGTKDAVVTQADIDNGDYKQEQKDDPKYQSMDYSKLTPLLTAALQEAVAKIETLEAKVAALEAK
jgi:uncharacterized protein YjbI with pentapeptide repeats